MRGYMPWFEIYVYSGVVLIVGIIAAILTIIYGGITPIEGMLSLWGCFVSFVLVCFLFVRQATHKQPTFVTKHGIAVWTNGVSNASQQVIEVATEFYIHSVVTDNALRVASIYDKVTPAALERMFQGSTLEWKKSIITMAGYGWSVKDVAGLQQGKSVIVQWNEDIKKSALFHEWHHMVDEIVLNRAPDYAHTNILWWGVLTRIGI